MSYILRNLTRGDLILANNILIKQNGCIAVEEITDQLNEEKLRGLISIIEEGVKIPVITEIKTEKVVEEIKPIIEEPKVEEIKPVEVIEENVKEIVEEVIEEVVEEKIEHTTSGDQSHQKSSNYNNSYNNKKFKKN